MNPLEIKECHLDAAHWRMNDPEFVMTPHDWVLFQTATFHDSFINVGQANWSSIETMTYHAA
jgi:hypothetical protein